MQRKNKRNHNQDHYLNYLSNMVVVGDPVIVPRWRVQKYHIHGMRYQNICRRCPYTLLALHLQPHDICNHILKHLRCFQNCKVIDRKSRFDTNHYSQRRHHFLLQNHFYLQQDYLQSKHFLDQHTIFSFSDQGS